MTVHLIRYITELAKIIKQKKAAKATNGIVMTYENELINAYYFSTSCGYTTDYRIWGKEKSYTFKERILQKIKQILLKKKTSKNNNKKYKIV